MNLEQQVCSLELAKKLKELGVEQNGFWSWYEAKDRDDTVALNRSSDKNCPTCGFPTAPWDEEFSAFTVAELGEMLPMEMTYGVHLEEWACWWGKHSIYGETEADARAKMLIYLLENKLITV